MNIFDWIILAAIMIAAAAAVIKMRKGRKKGCSGGCANCTENCMSRSNMVSRE